MGHSGKVANSYFSLRKLIIGTGHGSMAQELRLKALNSADFPAVLIKPGGALPTEVTNCKPPLTLAISLECSKLHQLWRWVPRSASPSAGMSLHKHALGIHIPGLTVIRQHNVQNILQFLGLAWGSMGVIASTRRSRLRGIQSALPM
jgi:hypothetical protein